MRILSNVNSMSKVIIHDSSEGKKYHVRECKYETQCANGGHVVSQDEYSKATPNLDVRISTVEL